MMWAFAPYNSMEKYISNMFVGIPHGARSEQRGVAAPAAARTRVEL